MFSRFLLFFGAAGGGLCAAAIGRRRALRGGDRPARIWCTIPRKPCSFVSFAPSPRAFSATGRFHPIKTPSRKRRVFLTRLASQSSCAGLPVSVGGRTRFIFSCYSLPRPLPRPATRRSTSVSFISSDTIMPSISSSFSTSSSGKRFRIRWQTMLM